MTNSRDKGKRGEREAAAALRDLGFKGARRGQQFQGSPDSPDVADAITGVHIEVKRTEKFNLYAALAQATLDAGKHDVPVVLHRRNSKMWVLALPLDRLWDFVGAVMATRAHGEMADEFRVNFREYLQRLYEGGGDGE